MAFAWSISIYTKPAFQAYTPSLRNSLCKQEDASSMLSLFLEYTTLYNPFPYTYVLSIQPFRTPMSRVVHNLSVHLFLEYTTPFQAYSPFTPFTFATLLLNKYPFKSVESTVFRTPPFAVETREAYSHTWGKRDSRGWRREIHSFVVLNAFIHSLK